MASLGPTEVLERWRSLAADLGLDPGSVSLADVELEGPEDWPAIVVEAQLDRLVALARRPRWRLDRDQGRIVPDPSGTPRLADLAGDLVDLLARRADDERRLEAVAELQAGHLPAERVAARWGTSRRSLFRWQRECQKRPLDVTDRADAGPEDLNAAGPVASLQVGRPDRTAA